MPGYCLVSTYAGSTAPRAAVEKPSHVHDLSCRLHPGTKIGAAAGGLALVAAHRQLQTLTQKNKF